MSADSGGRALGYGISISEIPLMVFLGYIVGRALGNEVEGAEVGAVLGIILLFAYFVWAYRHARSVFSGDGRFSEPSTK